MTYINEPTAHTDQPPYAPGGIIRAPEGRAKYYDTHDTSELIAVPGGSPRWLQIGRDAAVTLAAALLSVVLLWAIITGLRLRSALDDFTVPADPASTSATCTDPNVPWCVPAGD